MNIKKMKYVGKLAGVAAAVLFAGSALAEPALQVDINGGTYDASEESVVTVNGNFTVLALCDTDLSAFCLETTTFKLSVALTPQTSTAGDYGSIVINGVTYDVTGDMVYGNPPLEDFLAHDGGDLGSHSAFPTYFLELDVTFVGGAANTCGGMQYNVEDTPGTCDVSGSSSYFDAFVVDATGLADGFGLHFDLYDTTLMSSTDIDVNKFAPFSHDASYQCCEDRKVPEPGTLGLLGIGLLGLGLTRRRRLTVQS